MVAFAHQRRFFLHQFLGMESGVVLGGGDPAQLEQLHDLVSHQAEEGLLGLIEISWLVIQHAYGAEWKAGGRL